MFISKKLSKFILLVIVGLSVSGLQAETYSKQKEELLALGTLTAVPKMMPAVGFESTAKMKAIFFDALPWKGKTTKVFAWVGLPENRSGKVPGVVLVHGGGGTADKKWVQRWNDRGFAAISLSVEGHMDVRIPPSTENQWGAWKPHVWAGPIRAGIYHDAHEPMADQWMYHAVADTILANSLLRSLPEVEADQVGLMGISWGGVISSTVVGLDSRFRFAIHNYGCGNLAAAKNRYGAVLRQNGLYKNVWDPNLRLNQASMPTFWFSWPGDEHFPLDCLATSAAVTKGLSTFSFIPELQHGHSAGKVHPEVYDFAESIVKNGRFWCEQTASMVSGGKATVYLTSDRRLEKATLISTTDDGDLANRNWIEIPAVLQGEGRHLNASGSLPEGVTAWYFNVHHAGKIFSSRYVVESKNVTHVSIRSPEELANFKLFYAMIDADQNRALTFEEVAAFWRNAFLRFDQDGDGFHSGVETNPSILQQADQNKDGRLSPLEDAQLRKNHFQTMDKNADGTLTLDEFMKN